MLGAGGTATLRCARVLALREGIARPAFPTARADRDRLGHARAQFGVAEKARRGVDDPDHPATGMKVMPPVWMDGSGVLPFVMGTLIA